MSGLPAASFRIGQISGGAPRGAWSTTDWIPIIVKSSVTLGALPEARGASPPLESDVGYGLTQFVVRRCRGFHRMLSRIRYSRWRLRARRLRLP